MTKLCCPACGLGLFNPMRYDVGDSCPRCLTRRGERVALAARGVSLGQSARARPAFAKPAQQLIARSQAGDLGG